MTEKILIIEDEDKIARFIELELSHEGYDVSKENNGRTGLEAAESGRFDLILLDIMLPELNGTGSTEAPQAFLRYPCHHADCPGCSQ